MPVTPDTSHKLLSNNRIATMLGSSHSPPVASGLDDAGSGMPQPSEREAICEGSAPEDILHNTGAAANANVGKSVPDPTEVSQLKLFNDAASKMDIPKPSGNPANAEIGTAIPIHQKVPQLKFVKVALQTATQKLVGSSTNADNGADALMATEKVAPLKLGRGSTSQMTEKPTSVGNVSAMLTPRMVPWLKIVKDVTPQLFTPKPASGSSNIDYRTAVSRRLVNNATQHTATQMTATTEEKDVMQKKRKASSAIGDCPVTRHKLNTNDADAPSSLPSRSSESSNLCCFSKAVLKDSLRSLAKIHLGDEPPAPAMLATLSTNTLHLSRSELMDNLRSLAKNHTL